MTTFELKKVLGDFLVVQEVSIMTDYAFCQRAQNCNSVIVDTLRKAILKDVKKSRDDELITLRTYNKYVTFLPPLERYPQEFQTLFNEAMIDIDMKDDLERSNIINWCRTAKKVVPLKTTADGNCLLHAVSQSLWGIEDTELSLRRLLYVNIVTDPNGSFKRRWLLNQRSTIDVQRFNVRFNTEEYSVEWGTVIKATDDITRESNYGLPYTSLESIHLYILANMLQRPIIVLADSRARTVYGQSLQESHISGIYLPLEWKPEQCHKSPIIIGYNMNHFAPLMFEQDIQTSQCTGMLQAIPLVTKDMESLIIRYLLPGEEKQCMNFLKTYLRIKEVVYGSVVVPSAEVSDKSLPVSVNIMEACRIDCERKFSLQMNLDLNPNPQVNVEPFECRIGERKEAVLTHAHYGHHLSSRHKVHHAVAQHEIARKQCTTIGCDLYADPDLQGLCSKCFDDYTVQFAHQEEAAKKMVQLQPQVAISAVGVLKMNNQEFHDLSMMGEDCIAKCGFKCSTETYPYCHECYPKFIRPAQTKQPEQETQPEQQDLSLMPEYCKIPNCNFRCSKATHPYCHQCFENIGAAMQTEPTAPLATMTSNMDLIPRDVPPLVQPMVQQIISAGIAPTHLVGNQTTNLSAPVQQAAQINRQMTQPRDTVTQSGPFINKCQTVQCNNKAVRGNNGFCDNCYQLTYFAQGNIAGASPADIELQEMEHLVPCTTPHCKGKPLMEIRQCKQCFVKQPGPGFKYLTSNTGMPLNIVEMSEEKIKNIKPQDRSCSPTERSPRSMQSQCEDIGARASVTSVTVELQPGKNIGNPTGAYIKNICSTPGCMGIRLNNPQSLCLTCLRAAAQGCTAGQRQEVEQPANAQIGTGSDLNESVTFISCTPLIPTNEEIKLLNPVVLSSKDKIKCATPWCEQKIYPPKKLCDECCTLLQKSKADKTKKANKISVEKEGQQKCQFPGCQFYGSAKYKDYCSSCFKSRVKQKFHTAPLTKTVQTAPNTRHTVPLQTSEVVSSVQQPSSQSVRNNYPVQRSGDHCAEPGCSRFGDPKQANRCFQHYQQFQLLPLSSEFVEQGQQLLRMQEQIPLLNTSSAIGAEAQSRFQNGSYSVIHGSVMPQAVDPCAEALTRLETANRSTKICKNSFTGCGNYGNSRKQGYCNTCFPGFQRLEQVKKRALAADNVVDNL